MYACLLFRSRRRADHGGRDRHACFGVESVTPIAEALKARGIPFTMSKCVFAAAPHPARVALMILSSNCRRCISADAFYGMSAPPNVLPRQVGAGGDFLPRSGHEHARVCGAAAVEVMLWCA